MFFLVYSCKKDVVDFVGWEAGWGDFFAVVAEELRDEAVFCVREFFQLAIKINGLDREFFRACDREHLVGGVFDGECFSASGFAVDEDVAWFFSAERGGEDVCDLLYLCVAVGDGVGGVIALER